MPTHSALETAVQEVIDHLRVMLVRAEGDAQAIRDRIAELEHGLAQT